MSNEEDDRLKSELSLLEAMYPDQVVFDSNARELRYTTDHGSFQVRLPPGYLQDELPIVISTSFYRTDGREALANRVKSYDIGEEVLDSVILAFNDLLEQHLSELQSENISNNEISYGSTIDNQEATVIVWLHHLLNTNKRKQALAPPSSEVSGATKPGYPGVLLYSGPAKAVHEHVNELRQLNWQAFSVRLESDEAWTFEHGTGVQEFETMKEVVADIDDDKKQLFMESMRMK